MGKFADAAERAARNVERLSRALESLPSGVDAPGIATGSGGGGGADFGSPQSAFNATIVFQEPRTQSGGSGGGSGAGGSGPLGSDIQSKAFAFFGLSSAGKSSVFIQQIVAEFRRITKSDAMTIRIGGGG